MSGLQLENPKFKAERRCPVSGRKHIDGYNFKRHLQSHAKNDEEVEELSRVASKATRGGLRYFGDKDTWEDYVLRMLIRNGQFEYELARDLKQVVKGDLMYTGVIGDGGLGTRAYGGKNMISAAGVNWTGLATSMEQEIIVQGFMDSEETHKLQYRFYIGDGDSSTYAKVVQKCAYGREVRKLHCAKHVTVRVRLSDHLHALLKKTKEYPVQARNLLKAESVSASAKGPVMQTRIDRLVKGVRTAIRNCGDQKGDVDSLQRELENAPFHVFGHHTNCGTWRKRKAAEVPEEDAELVHELRLRGYNHCQINGHPSQLRRHEIHPRQFTGDDGEDLDADDDPDLDSTERTEGDEPQVDSTKKLRIGKAEMDEGNSLPNMSKATLQWFLNDIGFVYSQRKRRSARLERTDYFDWRQMHNLRAENKNIFSLGRR
ncbi:hypothetical protein FOCC_FOCC007305 [Frankliniella occidentalis]|nr:hypothetical protein FOCC_FOCC007305 [Frankliniella occidentalis]